MIRLACPCGHRFVRPDSDAGMVVVCPGCGLVNEIVRHHAADRPLARAVEVALAVSDRETISNISESATPPRGIAGILSAMTDAPNLIVIVFSLIIHLLLIGAVLAMTINLYLIAPVCLVLAIAVLAHWANVLDDIGVEEKDELPRLFRDLQVREDFIAPFAGVVTSLILCYGPAILILFSRLSISNALSVAIALALVGTFFFPAVLLTLVTSGSQANLRPDRVLGVIDGSGQRYLNVVLTFVLASIPYGCAIAAIVLKIMKIAGRDIAVPEWVLSAALSIPIFGIGIFLMHGFCWHLGLLYRADSESFPWVGRVHIREIEKTIARRKPNYVESEPMPIESSDLIPLDPSDATDNP